MISRIESTDELDKPQSTFQDKDKRVAIYTVCKKSMYTVLWRVTVDKGPPPKELAGNWTSMEYAEAAVVTFLKNTRPSHVVSEQKAIKNLRELRQDKHAPEA
jgi:hypothetical protein|tara:strand:- start:564 stop:869 length:306 start_codon:yes stop_codon:yes gene_type:complete